MFTKVRLGSLSVGVLLLISGMLTSFPFRLSADQSSSAGIIHADSIDILHYTININIHDLASKTISGITDIQAFTLQDSVHTIRLMLQHLTVDSVWIDEERIKNISRHKNVILVRLPDIPDKGSTILLTVFYHGHPVHDPHWGGFYFTPHAAFNMGVGMTVSPHPYGRTWFPCVDNFTDKATYDYFITVPDTLVAACPGTLQKIIRTHGRMLTYHWSLADPIPTYLSSVAVSKYTILTDSLHGLTGLIPTYYFVRPQDVSKARITFSHVPEYLRVFETLFGPYRWEKIGYASVPFFKGAMEHATCISIPAYVINGTHDFDDLLSHEFAHSWFGNLVTCRTARDMWLNEGWATYCEALYREFSRGKVDYNRFISENHKKVLQFTYITDGGYYPVYGIPDCLTYGSTVYQKGADVIYTLRNYLGDKVFFDALKIYFRKFAFQNISTGEFESFLTKTTHRDMTDFFNTWIYAPGFPHFSLDSFLIIKDRDDFITGLFLKQRLKGRKDYSYNIPLAVTLLDKSWKREDDNVMISGPLQKKTLITSFRPVAVMINLDEHLSDATTSGYKIIRHTGQYTFENCFFRLDVNEMQDSSFFRVVHHWIGPEMSKKYPAGLTLSMSRYWSIEGVIPSSPSWEGNFYYNFSHSMKNGWLDTIPPPVTGDRLTLVYRPSLNSSWQKIPSEQQGNNLSGFLKTPFIKKGEYCVAIIKQSGSK